VLEYARSVHGMTHAFHAEYGGDPATALIAPIACAVPGDGPTLNGSYPIHLRPESVIAQIYGATEIAEAFTCSYGVNPAARARLLAGELQEVGWSDDGETRAIALPGHRFFLATLFLPQLGSTPARPHPLIIAFLEASARFAATRSLAGR